MKPYVGNCRRGLRDSGAFSLRRGPRDDFRVEIIQPLGHREVALLSNEEHPQLVEMVLDAQRRIRGVEGGRFLINEFGHVLVRDAGACYCAGIYPNYIEFDFEGRVIGPKAPSDLQPGGDWPGPGIGIRYTANAEGDDIYYERNDGTRATLSSVVGEGPARRLASRLARPRPGGGNLYINHAKEFFAVPINGQPPYIYLGSLGGDQWFGEPGV